MVVSSPQDEFKVRRSAEFGRSSMLAANADIQSWDSTMNERMLGIGIIMSRYDGRAWQQSRQEYSQQIYVPYIDATRHVLVDIA